MVKLEKSREGIFLHSVFHNKSSCAVFFFHDPCSGITDGYYCKRGYAVPQNSNLESAETVRNCDCHCKIIDGAAGTNKVG